MTRCKAPIDAAPSLLARRRELALPAEEERMDERPRPDEVGRVDAEEDGQEEEEERGVVEERPSDRERAGVVGVGHRRRASRVGGVGR